MKVVSLSNDDDDASAFPAAGDGGEDLENRLSSSQLRDVSSRRAHEPGQSRRRRRYSNDNAWW